MDAIQENNIEELAVFGDRKLLAGDDPFKHNAWDKVDWSEEQEKEAIALLGIQKQSSGTADLSLFDDDLAANQWNAFYTINENKFFKDRHWLGREFPKVFADLPTKESKKQFVFLEIGCGTGATVCH
jgi:tRNAThr (cytosine32-N3)-methyltransferase